METISINNEIAYQLKWDPNPKIVNRYTLTFPNVSTIENTVNNRK